MTVTTLPNSTKKYVQRLIRQALKLPLEKEIWSLDEIFAMKRTFPITVKKVVDGALPPDWVGNVTKMPIGTICTYIGFSWKHPKEYSTGETRSNGAVVQWEWIK